MKRFNTFEGVFTPTLLSILGVIMYLRLGWVVGQVGLGAALGIVVLANVITLATALSMSSIVTNIRIGTGGAYSIIAKSLGIEAGGAVGIPLYLSQAISVAFYITGFSECWIAIFPAHNMLLISLIVWASIFVISYCSAKLAFRLQYVIMAIVGLSLVSIFFASNNLKSAAPALEGIAKGSFWMVFAIFFPAVTGILAGASMSGELTEPRKSIPNGTLSAIAISFCIYIGLAFWLANNASAAELANNTSIIIDLGRWKWLVIGGIMGATLSSALSMFVGSPRTLLALSKHSIVPFSSSFARINKKGEPVAAILFTSLLVLITLLKGTLNSVASLLTMFFLVTYGMINLSVFIEQVLGIVSFRPTFKVPRIVPLFGGLGCLAVMFLINIKFSIIAFLCIVLIYVVLLRKGMEVHSPNIRSGLLIFLAEKFAQAAKRLPYYPKIWKPNIIVTVEEIGALKDRMHFIESIIWPSGRVLFLKVIEKDPKDISGILLKPITERPKTIIEKVREEMSSAVESLVSKGLFVETSVIESPDICSGNIVLMQAAKNMTFPPNALFYSLETNKEKDDDVIKMIKKAENDGLGIIVLKEHDELGFREGCAINLWIRKGSPNIDLAILLTLQLKYNWEGDVRILQVVGDESESVEAQNHLEKLKKVMRLPSEIEIYVISGEFKSILPKSPPADINIFGMSEEPDLALIREISGLMQTSVLFIRDSAHENAFA